MSKQLIRANCINDDECNTEVFFCYGQCVYGKHVHHILNENAAT